MSSPINRYFLRFRDKILLILARSIPEAMEPWARINNRRITQEEFQSALIEETSNRDFLLLTGSSVTRDELKSFQKEKFPVLPKNDFALPVKATKPEAKLVDVEKVTPKSKIKSIEDFIEF